MSSDPARRSPLVVSVSVKRKYVVKTPAVFAFERRGFHYTCVNKLQFSQDGTQRRLHDFDFAEGNKECNVVFTWECRSISFLFLLCFDNTRRTRSCSVFSEAIIHDSSA